MANTRMGDLSGSVSNSYNAKPSRAEYSISNLNRREIRHFRKQLKKEGRIDDLLQFEADLKEYRNALNK